MLHQYDPDYPGHGDCQWTKPQDGLHCWSLPMTSYVNQVRKHCMECGVPMRGFGELSQAVDGVESISGRSRRCSYEQKRPDRLLQPRYESLTVLKPSN